MKRFVHAKNIILWCGALILIITAICLFAYHPQVITKFYNNATGTGLQEFKFNISMTGKTVIDLSEVEWAKAIAVKDGPRALSLTVQGNNLFVIGPLLILLAGLAIVGLTFLKPCKLRGWGFILCMLLAVAGIVVFVIALNEMDKSFSAYLKREIKNGSDTLTYRSYLSDIRYADEKGALHSVYSFVSLLGVTMSTIICVYIPLLALPTMIVGMAFRVKAAKAVVVQSAIAETVEEQSRVEEQVEEEKPVEEKTTFADAVLEQQEEVQAEEAHEDQVEAEEETAPAPAEEKQEQ